MDKNSERVLVIGASDKPERYSYKATRMLLDHGHEPILMSNKNGSLFDIDFIEPMTALSDIDTVTMYVSAKLQGPYYDYLYHLKPKRVIFNPGTENPELKSILESRGIQYEEACTLVMLSTGQF